MLCPQWLCRHHDQERGGGGGHFGRRCCSSTSRPRRRSMPKSWPRSARPIPALAHLLGQEPSTATLVELIRGMVRHFLDIADGPDQEEAQRLRLMVTSHLDDGEFARLLYDKIGELIGPIFAASLEAAIAAGDAVADRPRAAQSVLVCASHRADGGADAASRRALSCVWRRRRSRTAALRIHSSRHRTYTKPQLLRIWTAISRTSRRQPVTAESA